MMRRADMANFVQQIALSEDWALSNGTGDSCARVSE